MQMKLTEYFCSILAAVRSQFLFVQHVVNVWNSLSCDVGDLTSFVSCSADHTARLHLIGYWHDTVVCPSVNNRCDAVYFGAQGRCRGLELESYTEYRRVPSTALPIFRHFCYIMYLLATNGEKSYRKRLQFKTANK